MDQDFLAWLPADVGSRALEVWHSGLQMRDESSEPTETSLKSIYLWETLWIPQISATKMHMYISAWYQWCLLWYWKPIPGCDQCALQSGKTRKGKETTVWWFIAQDPLPKLPRSKCCHSVGPQQSMNPKWNRKEMGVGPKMSRFYLNTPNQTLWLDHSIQVVPFKIVICFPFVRTSTRKSLVLWWWRNITVQGSPWLASREFYHFHLTHLIATTCICSIKYGAHTHTHIYIYIYYRHTYLE